MELTNHLAKAAAYGASFFAVYTLTTVIYRLFFHPLRNYPGPFFAKFTDAWSGYHAIKKDIHLATRECVVKHGPVVRLGPNKLVFTTPQAAQDIYLNERLSKSSAYTYTAAVRGVYGVFNVVDKTSHQFKRKLVGQAISARSMRIFEPAMLEQIDILLRLLAKSAQQAEVVNMSTHVGRMSYDIVSLLAFGRSLNTQTDKKYRPFLDAQISVTYWSNMFLQFPFIRKAKMLEVYEIAGFGRVFAYFKALESMVAARVAEEKHAQHDLYSLVVDQMNPDGQFLRDSEIWAEAAFFFPAGADTVSTLICSTLFYLAHNPHAYKLLAEEIRTTFLDGGDVNGGQTLSNCKYLRACLDESLRISPPAGGTLWRELDPNDPSKEPFIVDGRIIPKGVVVGVNNYTLLHDEKYFPEPFEYRPERWLETGSNQRGEMLDAFIPFSIGTRACAGKAMAYSESSLVIAKILWYFDFKLAPGALGKVGEGATGLGVGRERTNEFQLYDIVSSIHDGPNLKFSQRVDFS